MIDLDLTISVCHNRTKSNVFNSAHFCNITGVWLHKSGILGATPDGNFRFSATHNKNHQVVELTDLLRVRLLNQRFWK